MSAKLSVLLCLTLLTGCSGASNPKALTDQGSEALRSGKYEDAADSFEQALAKLGGETSGPEWMRAKLGSIEAQTHIDATKATEDFLSFAASNPDRVTDSHFNLIGSRLGDSGHLAEAFAVLEAGKKAHPESPHLEALLNELGKKAESSGDPDALEAIKSLGYVGD